MGRTSFFRDDIARIGNPFPVTLCHIPPGNPANAQTIEVAQAAVPAHLAHGDLLGECPYECDGVPAPVAATGQTISYGPGDDGEYQKGVSVDPRFTDNGDGSVTDNLTGLIWLQNVACLETRGSRQQALLAANTLADGTCGLTDGSVAGDWRLSNVRELLSLIDYGRIGSLLPFGHPFDLPSSDLPPDAPPSPNLYWSATSQWTYDYGVLAWLVNPETSWVTINHPFGGFGHDHHVWPVRGGQ
jgi:hypothetical protein